MNVLSGKVVTQANRKINELVSWINTYFATNGIASLTGVTVGGAGTRVAITASSAVLGFSVTATTQTANDLNTITTSTAVTSAALMKALNVSMTTTGVSASNMIEVARFTLTTAVKNGAWANAIVGKIDLTSAGYVTGLAGAVCGELDLPTTNPAGGSGTYTVFEGELNVPTGFTSTVPVSFINLNAWGAGVANFDTYGYIMDITGLTKASGKVFQDNTAAAASQALRIRVNGTAYYIMLTSTGA